MPVPSSSDWGSAMPDDNSTEMAVVVPELVPAGSGGGGKPVGALVGDVGNCVVGNPHPNNKTSTPNCNHRRMRCLAIGLPIERCHSSAAPDCTRSASTATRSRDS